MALVQVVAVEAVTVMMAAMVVVMRFVTVVVYGGGRDLRHPSVPHAEKPKSNVSFCCRQFVLYLYS